MARRTLQNRYVSLSLDNKGRIVRLKNKLTDTELVSHPRASEAWRMIIPTGRHTVDIVWGSQQAPPKVELGVDGLELDTFEPSPCHNPAHNHPKGADMSGAKIEFVRAVRAHARRLNPDFALIGETMVPEAREVLDGYYSFRYTHESDRIFRYLFPEIREQTVLVGNYAYDQVNKALTLGIGVNTECDGLRSTALAACPELARYIGEVNRFRRKYADILIRGTFRDTVGAHVAGDCLYSVLEGPRGSKALALRNPHDRRVRAEGRLARSRKLDLRLWRLFAPERRVRSLPVRVTLKPYEAAVLLAVRPGA